MAVRTYSFQLYRPRPTDSLTTNRKILRDDMKLCSRMAAFQGKQVVLLVHQDLGADCLLDASIFMNEGKCWTVILKKSANWMWKQSWKQLCFDISRYLYGLVHGWWGEKTRNNDDSRSGEADKTRQNWRLVQEVYWTGQTKYARYYLSEHDQ